MGLAFRGDTWNLSVLGSVARACEAKLKRLIALVPGLAFRGDTWNLSALGVVAGVCMPKLKRLTGLVLGLAAIAALLLGTNAGLGRFMAARRSIEPVG